jgi:hypothetical protein
MQAPPYDCASVLRPRRSHHQGDIATDCTLVTSAAALAGPARCQPMAASALMTKRGGRAGTPAAPRGSSLPLLPLGSGGVRRTLPRRTRPDARAEDTLCARDRQSPQPKDLLWRHGTTAGPMSTIFEGSESCLTLAAASSFGVPERMIPFASLSVEAAWALPGFTPANRRHRGCGVGWRRGWDLNPRSLSAHALSRRAR